MTSQIDMCKESKPSIKLKLEDFNQMWCSNMSNLSGPKYA